MASERPNCALAVALAGLDFVRLQIGFWEKVVVLDAATLAASFTAIGMFREHLFGDGGVGYLEAAWKLLFSGMAFAC